MINMSAAMVSKEALYSNIEVPNLMCYRMKKSNILTRYIMDVIGDQIIFINTAGDIVKDKFFVKQYSLTSLFEGNKITVRSSDDENFASICEEEKFTENTNGSEEAASSETDLHSTRVVTTTLFGIKLTVIGTLNTCHKLYVSSKE